MNIDWQDIRSNRSLRRFLDPSSLIALLRKPCGDEDLRIQLAVELIVRAWLLSGKSCIKSSAFEHLAEGLEALSDSSSALYETYFYKNDINTVIEWCEKQSEQRTFEFPSCAISSSERRQTIQPMVNCELKNWQNADGFVVLVPESDNRADNHGLAKEGVALPFFLDFYVREANSLLRFRDDEPLSDKTLQNAVKIAHRLAQRYTRQRNIDNAPAVKLSNISGFSSFENSLSIIGGSIGIPVFLALMLSSSDSAQNNFFEWGGSGFLNDSGCLEPGGHQQEQLLIKEELLCMMGIKHRFLPPLPAGERRYKQDDTVSLPPENPCGKIIELFRQTAPSSPAIPPVKKDLRNISDTVNELQQKLRYSPTAAPSAKEELEKILSIVEKDTSVRAQELRLCAKASLASAESHLGHFERAAALCREVAEDRHCGTRYKAQTLVRLAVCLTDMTDYQEAVKSAEAAHELAEHLSSATEKIDMQMQASGTIGQACCFWALREPAKIGPAFQYISESCAYAKELWGTSPEKNPELPRNLCYWYLAHTLLRPEEAEEVYRQVENTCSFDKKTEQFLRQRRWLSAYRLYLQNKALPASMAKLDMHLPDITSEGGWLNRTAAKYRGALHAVRGDFDNALQDFDTANRLLNRDTEGSLLEFIGATACLQAGESLMPHYPEEADKYLRKAIEVFTKRQNWFSDELSGKNWLAWSESKLNRRPLNKTISPQMFYPY